jgi:ubiquinone/menaquinone biosynthesis C-methylase UbiE
MRSPIRRFVASLFHLLYNQLAWTYDLVAAAVSLGRWKEWVHSALPYLQGDHILELGFGPGHLHLSLHRRGWHVTGLDASPFMVRKAGIRLRQAGIQPRLIHGYAQSQPFRNAVFDTVVATFPSEYIVQVETLSEVRRVLKPGGRLVIVLGAWPGEQSILEQLTAWAFQVAGLTSGTPGEIPHEMGDRFIETGFDLRVETVQVQTSTVVILIASLMEMK